MCVCVCVCVCVFLCVQVLLRVSVHVAISMYSAIAIVAGIVSILLPIETKGREMTVSLIPCDAMLEWVLAVAHCLSLCVCLSVSSWCSVKAAGRIELVLSMETSFDPFCSVL